MIDKDQITQAVLNILLNSIEAVVKAGEIMIDVKRVNDGIRLSISDNSKGISRKMLIRYLSPSLQQKNPGTGIGLARL